ncbi:hypothetical protein OIE66_01855 [Nonomuraea sp. NBC_01738]|uniref:hypothetical protein n=1 Tax=Nonomuraea sp. NBC_01738 TaxID=2976003 RepID=UPI002E0F071E|nr:hypothetical protein OIE66_01855 [Nonomuraea sp. NBC_01738]
MPEAVFLIALVLIGVAGGVFIVIVLSIHVEDWRGSTTHRPPGPFTRGTRRILGLHVDHSACVYASNPDFACPKCKRSYKPSVN